MAKNTIRYDYPHLIVSKYPFKKGRDALKLKVNFFDRKGLHVSPIKGGYMNLIEQQIYFLDL